MVVLYLLLGLASIFVYFLNSIKKKFNYWKDRGVYQLNPHLIYGDTKKQTLLEICSAEMFSEFYNKFKKLGLTHGGVYNFNRPVWVPIDPNLIKLVVIKDSQYFSAHHVIPMNTLFFNNLFHMDGEKWKDMRRKLTPTFTTGKMKMMFDILLEKSNGLTDLVGNLAKSGETAEIKELLARYTTDVIGTCGFGIECDSINDPNSVFFQKGQDIFRKFTPTAPPNLFKLFVMLTGLAKRMSLDMSDIEDFFRQIVTDTVKYREENQIVRKDFLHLMIQLKNKGSITDVVTEKDVYQKISDAEQMPIEDVVGQCMLFFTAGFETSSTTMSFALLELTQYQDVQKKLRQEVQEVLEKYDGVLSYDALQEMTYCENIIHETLRKYPPLANLPRQCTKSYQVPNSDVVIAKGTTVQIPIYALQNDPDYYPEPEKFNPDRFNAHNKRNIVDCTYMPFGDGPRQCLGLRFGMMQSKAGLATLINRYNFTLNKKTPYPPKFASSAVLSVKGGIYLDVEEV